MMSEGSTVRVLRCRSGALEWAITEVALREVLPAGPAARIPGTVGAVRGLGNVRGMLLTVLDAGLILGQPVGAPDAALVVVEVAGRRVALAVDEVDDLYPIPIESLEPAAPVAGVPERAVIARVEGSRPFLLLDVETLVAPFFVTAPGQP
jgi:chemotaxis signal transduction protein